LDLASLRSAALRLFAALRAATRSEKSCINTAHSFEFPSDQLHCSLFATHLQDCNLQHVRDTCAATCMPTRWQCCPACQAAEWSMPLQQWGERWGPSACSVDREKMEATAC
jgi:hypothetical protein